MSSAPAQEPALKLDRRTYAQANACVHCGLCLPACPTYTQNGLEADSPRGRIHFMKSMADGRLAPTPNVVGHLDLCLDCRACETACPSGVVYHEVIEAARTQLADHRPAGPGQRFVRWLMFHVFTRPSRLKLALVGPRLLQKLGLWRPMVRWTAPIVPAGVAKLQSLLPERGPVWETRLARRYSPTEKPVMSVGFFAGCVSSVLEQELNRQMIALLRLGRCEVIVPRAQVCCGAIHHHAGCAEPAERMARRNIEAFTSVDRIVTGVAGCGAMLRDYRVLLRDDSAWAERAADLVARVRDVSELLAELDLPEPTHAIDRVATYHDACHLVHGQGVRDAPRRLLARVPGLKLVPLPETEICCGAAGTYNLEQPQMSRELAERKLGHIRRTGASVCVTGNIGCAMQIAAEARRQGMDLKIRHPVALLHAAHFGTPV